jgi:predicted ATPase/class 3 adenylate cyclase/Tfp pilus assembly protein PilF
MFLFTDIEDSTRLWQSAPEVMQVALTRHDAIMRDGIAAHGGEVFKTAGDAFYAAFPDPARGLDAALALQQALGDEPWPAATPIRVRMALHVGEAQARDGDWFGPPLNVVARMLTVARGAQTLVSAAARSCLDGSRAGAASTLGGAGAGAAVLESHGFFRMKGVDEPVEVFELGLRGKSAFTPPRDTDPVYRVVRDGDLWQPARAIRNNLPAERDAFVGRSAELHAIAQRLDDGERLLTLVGPAGTGKTRIVCRYGRAWLGDWPGGVYFCDLSDARTLDGIHFAVAMAIDVPLGRSDPAVQLGHAIAGRGRCLVILDNFEQVTEHAAATVGRWLERAGEAAFLVTSRERLHVAGEEILPIEPLPLDSDAIELFAARARAQRPGFALDAANRAAVAELVRLVDGLPLAIELAAARVRVFAPAQLVERMRDRFALLAGARGAAARQATLKAAIDWSWDLLSPWEKAAFGQCAVFEGGFTMEAAEAVVDLAAFSDAPPVMDAVQALVDKSLLRVYVPASERRFDLDEPYFGMYLSIHDYATERLAHSGAGAAQAAEDRHGRHYAQLGGDAAFDALARHGSVRVRHALALELDNLLAACRRAVARHDAAIAVPAYRAAWEALELRGPFSAAAALGSQVLALPEMPAALRALAGWIVGLVDWRRGKLDESERQLDAALAICHGNGDRRLEARVLGSLGNLYQSKGRLDESLAAQAAALAILREFGNRPAEGTTLGNLGNAHFARGNLDEARDAYERAIAIHREVGNRLIEGSVLSNLAGIHYEQGRVDQAMDCLQEALRAHVEVGDRRSEGVAIGNLAIVHRGQGRFEEALDAYARALAIHRELGDRHFEGMALSNLSGLHQLQGRTDEALATCRQALEILHEIGNRAEEGVVLGNLGTALVEVGRVDEAREAFRRGESTLREIGSRLGLAKFLCHRGQAEARLGDRDAARAALDEAERIAAAIGAGPDSELGSEVAALRGRLVPAAAP